MAAVFLSSRAEKGEWRDRPGLRFPVRIRDHLAGAVTAGDRPARGSHLRLRFQRESYQAPRRSGSGVYERLSKLAGLFRPLSPTRLCL
jgi:hypothetical protein